MNSISELESDKMFSETINMLFFIGLQDLEIISRLLGIQQDIIILFMQKYRFQIDNNTFIYEYIRDREETNESENECFPKSYEVTPREARRHSLLFKIDTEYEQKFSKYCSCDFECFSTLDNIGRKNLRVCLCISEGRECKPNICKCCCSYSPSLVQFFGNLGICENTNFFFRVQPKTLIKPSQVCNG